MILVFCPSRGRPKALAAAADSMQASQKLAETRLVGVVDADDPLFDEYIETEVDIVVPKVTGNMVIALNAAVDALIDETEEADILGFIGDDHRFRTNAWDEKIQKALTSRPGFAYGYDGFWHQGQIPTQIFISRPIISALGYFALPDCHHLYVDNAWAELGRATDSLQWLHNVYIEHLHPAIGKAEWDEGYLRVNNQAMYDRDRDAFEAWRDGPRLHEDVAKVQEALAMLIA